MKLLSTILREAGKTDEEVSEALSGKIEAYQGKALKNGPKIFTFDAQQYENKEEAKASEDWHVPDDGEIFKEVNRAKATSAKAQAYQKATAPLKVEYENSMDYKIADLVRAARGMGFSQAEAEALAASKALTLSGQK